MAVNWHIGDIKEWKTTTREHSTLGEVYDKFGLSTERIAFEAFIEGNTWWVADENDSGSLSRQTKIVRMKPFTRWLLFGSGGLSTIGITTLTAKNLKDAFARMLACGDYCSDWRPQLWNKEKQKWEYYSPTVGELRLHIGAYTNARSMSPTQFWKWVREEYEKAAHQRIKYGGE